MDKKNGKKTKNLLAKSWRVRTDIPDNLPVSNREVEILLRSLPQDLLDTFCRSMTCAKIITGSQED